MCLHVPRTPHPVPCRHRLSKELSKLQLEKRERACTYVRSSFLRFPAISAENSHCEKAKSSTAAAQPFLPDCKKVFHLISGSVCVCICVCLSCCTKHFSALWIWSGQVCRVQMRIRGSLAAAGAFCLSPANSKCSNCSRITAGFVLVAGQLRI